MMETELMRIGVSLPDTLLSKFDEIIEKRGYSSRSEGIRDAIRSYISYYEWMGDIKGTVSERLRLFTITPKGAFKCLQTSTQLLT